MEVYLNLNSRFFHMNGYYLSSNGTIYFFPFISYDISFPCLIALFRQVVRGWIYLRRVPNPIVSLFTIIIILTIGFFVEGPLLD